MQRRLTHVLRSRGFLAALALTLGLAIVGAIVWRGGSAAPTSTKVSHQARIDAGLAKSAGANAASKPTVGPPPPFSGPPQGSSDPPTTGILQLAQAPFRPTEYKIKNRWQRVRAGVLTQVYAGAEAPHPEQGIVILKLIRWPADQDISTHTFRTQKATGILQIVSGEDDTLAITSAGGSHYTFDIRRKTLTGT